jgi:2-C-methyl-D-erythritol 2,4-cyclodiphosphate synthase
MAAIQFPFRIGNGYDVHQLAEGHELWLGGMQVAHSKGAVAHSDGDVLIHALCDALLGAANLHDIGWHFPDTSEEFRGIDSKILLKKVAELVRAAGYELGNVDTVICLQQPKVKPLIPAMQQVLAQAMQVDVDRVSVKATTTEKLGFVGREEGIAAYAVVLLVAQL